MLINSIKTNDMISEKMTVKKVNENKEQDMKRIQENQVKVDSLKGNEKIEQVNKVNEVKAKEVQKDSFERTAYANAPAHMIQQMVKSHSIQKDISKKQEVLNSVDGVSKAIKENKSLESVKKSISEIGKKHPEIKEKLEKISAQDNVDKVKDSLKDFSKDISKQIETVAKQHSSNGDKQQVLDMKKKLQDVKKNITPDVVKDMGKSLDKERANIVHLLK